METKYFVIHCSDFRGVCDHIHRVIKDSYGSADLLKVVVNDYTEVYVFEKYFYRVNGNVMINLFVQKKDMDSITLRFISGGGKVGWSMVDYNAENAGITKFMKLLLPTLIEEGWTIENPDEKYQKIYEKIEQQLVKKKNRIKA